MNFYECAILNSPLTLSYQSLENLNIGRVVKVEVRNRVTLAVLTLKIERPTFECVDILEATDKFFPQSYMNIVKFISTYYFCSLGDSFNLFTPFKESQTFENSKIDIDIEFSKEQKEAIKFIDKNQTTLLFGDTGSGKTEIYINQIAKTINSGKSAIMLLPEISLTPQMEKRLKDKFGSLVEVWHSKVYKKRKEKILEKIYNSEVKLIAGARSSLFLPLQNLGLIVVDEEHDDSYKSNIRPRYSARDLSLVFAKNLKTKVILGSATPAITSYNKFPTFRLKGRFFKSKKELYFENRKTEISDFILNEIEKSLNSNHQIIIFLPTRANFKYLFCKSCGESFKCPYCSVGMSLHKKNNSLKCHYCNFVMAIPKECDICGSDELISDRIGTSEVVNILKDIFSEKVISKFDRDEIKTERELKATLKKFNDREIDILVGTQMLSKGHDYHNVNLAIILGIDSMLLMSDFRAREKALSLTLQIAGRSGRKSDGKVIIQTQNIEFFKDYIANYEELIRDELEVREELYPPYKKLVRVIFSHKNSKKAYDKMLEMVQNLKKFQKVEIIGYKEAEIFKISNKYRYNILLRSSSAKELIRAINYSKTDFCEIDIDPVNFS